jgi:hypothetical protein
MVEAPYPAIRMDPAEGGWCDAAKMELRPLAKPCGNEQTDTLRKNSEIGKCFSQLFGFWGRCYENNFLRFLPIFRDKKLALFLKIDVMNVSVCKK